MTTLVSLLFITMIPIDYKMQIFPLYLFVYFFSNSYNIAKLTSAISKERMSMVIIFAGATPIN